MKKFKLIFTALSLSSLMLLTACSQNSSASLQTKIKDKGKLVVALSPDYAPFEFKTLKDGKDTIVGSDIMLAQEIANKLDVALELSPMSFDNVLSSLQTGKADLAISGISYTKERAKYTIFQNHTIRQKMPC